jgi:non-ribosomal peptide synthetase component E (peptide arylation enzyme)
VTLADNGEVLVKSSAMLTGYYKRPDATAEVIDEQGYFHTGDAGIFDAEGHLKIIDRAADVGKLTNGDIFAPNYIENKLKFSLSSKKSSPLAMTETMSAPSLTLIWKPSATGQNDAASPIPVTPIWPQKLRRISSSCRA